MGNYSIRKTDARERLYENLRDATGENTTAGALDVAASYYLQMAGDNPGVPNGAVKELMEVATEEGSVTPEQIAVILGTDELPVTYSHEFDVGRE